MKARIASWVKWWREALAIKECRQMFAVLAVLLTAQWVSAGWSIHRDHVRDARRLSLNCACRCEP